MDINKNRDLFLKRQEKAIKAIKWLNEIKQEPEKTEKDDEILSKLGYEIDSLIIKTYEENV